MEAEQKMFHVAPEVSFSEHLNERVSVILKEARRLKNPLGYGGFISRQGSIRMTKRLFCDFVYILSG
jgi:hypothetical protein